MPSNLPASQPHRYHHRSGRHPRQRVARAARELPLIAESEERRVLRSAKQSLQREMERRGLIATRWARRALSVMDRVISRIDRAAVA